MKIKILTMASILLILGGVAMAVAQDQESDAPRMDTAAFETLKRPAALFDHDAHNETAELEECGVCHHVWENGQIVEGESSEDSPCSDCHSIKATPENGMALANAYHTQCRTCHVKTGKGPLLCGECHKNE